MTTYIKNQVNPTDSNLANLAVARVKECIRIFENITGKTMTMPSCDLVVFFEKSRTGGYVWPTRFGNRVFLNWPLLKANFECYLRQTIPHEVAHLFQRMISPTESSHGRIWKNLMVRFGIPADRCHSYDTTFARRDKEVFTYICNCQKFQLSKVVHNRILKGRKYTCKRCKQGLVFLSQK